MAPKSHVDYWEKKIARNRARDIETSQLLTRAGWKVLRFWSHQSPDDISKVIVREINKADSCRSKPAGDDAVE